MKKLLYTLLVCAFAALVTFAQTEQKVNLSGTWQIEYHDKNGKEVDTPTVSFMQTGGRLEGVFGDKHWKLEGTVVGVRCSSSSLLRPAPISLSSTRASWNPPARFAAPWRARCNPARLSQSESSPRGQTNLSPVLPDRRRSSGEPYARNPLKGTAVSGQQRAAVAGHDAGNQTVGHSNGIARSFEGSANLTGGVGRRVVQPQRWHSPQQLNQAGKLLRALRTREELKPADDRSNLP